MNLNLNEIVQLSYELNGMKKDDKVVLNGLLAQNSVYALGDYNNIYNGAAIIIDDTVSQIDINLQGGDFFINNSNTITLETVSLSLLSITTAAAAGALIGYLVVNINGTTRKIPYYAN